MEKTFTSTQKYLLISPLKVREVASLIRKMKPMDAVVKLEFVNKRSSEFILKVVKTAIAQAKVAGVNPEELYFKEIQILEGPVLKRGRAASRGRWHPYVKKMTHIRVVVGVKQKVQKVEKKEKNKNGTKS